MYIRILYILKNNKAAKMVLKVYQTKLFDIKVNPKGCYLVVHTNRIKVHG